MNKFTVYRDEKLCERYYYLKHESGLDIYVFPKKMTLKVALLGVKFGSVYENGAVIEGVKKSYPSGIAHFLEHKLFSNEDGVDATEALAKIGADSNAYTSNNKTVYMFTCTENFDEALRGLIRFVYNPYFTAENVESEKGIITQEIKMCNDSPYDVVSQNLLLALYGESKLSEDVLGTEQSISLIDEKLLYDCYSTFYRHSNMALVLCGDIDEGRVLEIVNESITEKIPQSVAINPEYSYQRAVVMPYVEKNMPISQSIFEIGIKDVGPSPVAAERLKRDVVMTILGEMLFSRAGEFYNELFEGGYINESYTYGYSTTREVAFFSIYGEGDDPGLVFEKVKDYVKAVKTRGLCEKDFIRCKRVMMAEFLRDFDSVDDIANSVLNFGFESSDIFEYRKIIESVCFDDVIECLNSAFMDDFFAISVIKNNN